MRELAGCLVAVSVSAVVDLSRVQRYLSLRTYVRIKNKNKILAKKKQKKGQSGAEGEERGGGLKTKEIVMPPMVSKQHNHL